MEAAPFFTLSLPLNVDKVIPHFRTSEAAKRRAMFWATALRSFGEGKDGGRTEGEQSRWEEEYLTTEAVTKMVSAADHCCMLQLWKCDDEHIFFTS